MRPTPVSRSSLSSPSASVAPLRRRSRRQGLRSPARQLAAIAQDMGAIAHAMMADVVGPYEHAEHVAEWAWVMRASSYDCRDNGRYGVLECIVNLCPELNLEAWAGPVPNKIAQLMSQARAAGADYLLFY